MTAPTATRTATVATDAPARWAKQLASHLGRPGKMTAQDTPRGPHLSMALDGVEATCLLDTTDPGALSLHVGAGDEAAADRMAAVVGSHLERFGAKAGLSVTWAGGSPAAVAPATAEDEGR